MEEAREVIGVDTPINPDKVRELIVEYEKAALQLEKWGKEASGPADWDDQKKKIQRKGRQVLLNLVQHLPRRGYARVVELLNRFTRLFDGCDKVFGKNPEGIDLKKLVEEHHARLAEFRQYAGMK